jgi:hypothetical protein
MSTVSNWRGPSIVKDGLVLYLDAGSPNSYYDKSSTTWKDISGGSNNGTLTNGPTYNTDSGGSIVFDGTNDYVDITALSLSTWTVSCFFKSANVSGNFKGIIEFALTIDGRSGIGINANGKPLISYPPSKYVVSADATVDTSTWYHLTGTYDGTTAKLYLNGVIQNMGGVNSSINAVTLNKIFIGNFAVGSYYLNGNVSIVNIYNRTLSATEILQNFNATKTRFGL